MSEGLELADLNVPFPTAVSGGTGIFRGASGQVEQKAIDGNPTVAPSFTFRFRVGP